MKMVFGLLNAHPFLAVSAKVKPRMKHWKTSLMPFTNAFKFVPNRGCL